MEKKNLKWRVKEGRRGEEKIEADGGENEEYGIKGKEEKEKE